MIFIYFILYSFFSSLAVSFLSSLGINIFIGLNIVAMFFIIFLTKKYKINYQQMRQQWNSKKFFYCFLVYVGGFFLLALILPTNIDKIPQDIDKLVRSNMGLITIVCVVFVIPILEEIFFRHLLLDWLKKHMNTITSILVSSLLFSICHYDKQFNLDIFFTIFILGVLFSLMREYIGKSLLYPTVFHMMQNFLAVLSFFPQ